MMTNDAEFKSVTRLSAKLIIFIYYIKKSYNFTRIGHQIFLITLCFDLVNTHIRTGAMLDIFIVANLTENLPVNPGVNLSHRQLSGAFEACRTSLMEPHSIIRDYFLSFVNSASTPSAALCFILLKNL